VRAGVLDFSAGTFDPVSAMSARGSLIAINNLNVRAGQHYLYIIYGTLDLPAWTCSFA